ncbi:MAG TPA: hypothetical protein VJ944_04470 [Thermoplasmataceae archaeon]|nr:hypothetical protein [Thermoplasmataceae archaeon]
MRFGRLYLDENDYYDVPALAPLPIKGYDVEVMSRLKSDGLNPPIIITPLRHRQPIKGMVSTATIFGEGNVIGQIKENRKTLLIPDIESETLSVNTTARDSYFIDRITPAPVKSTLMRTSLAYYENKESGYKNFEYMGQWDDFKSDYGLATLRNYYEKMQSELGSPIFFAPTPLIRIGNGSLDKAFQYGNEMLLTSQKQTFKGLGIHLLIHSEAFGQGDGAVDLRNRLIQKIMSLGGHSNTGFSSFPFVSIKVYDPSDYLVKGTQASIYRMNLSSTLVAISENVREINGFLVMHNMGRWSLGGIDSGADVVSFRSDGKPFEIENHYHRRRSNKKKEQRRVIIQKRAAKKDRVIPPFNPEKLSDGDINEFKSAWEEKKYFAHPPHVMPEAWWLYSTETDGWKYRARVIVDSMMTLDKEIRDMASSDIPIVESVAGRVARMGEQDPMTDLCPSLFYRH